MTSKGVDYYTNGGFAGLTFAKPCDWGGGTQPYTLSGSGMQVGNLQIGEEDISVLSHTGRYVWSFVDQGNTIASRYAEIAPSTGDIGDTNLSPMLQTPSVFNGDYTVSYGFYDSSTGLAGLTDQDQSYVYVTPDQSNWMGALVATHGAVVGQAPFSGFVLPGAHDSGMYDVTQVQSLVQNQAFLQALSNVTQVPLAVLEASAATAVRAIINLAFTQKENFTSMLDLGVRYFDFRPGYVYMTQGGPLYHQHDFIPGAGFDDMLGQVVAWLGTHPTEIVVLNLNFQGMYDATMQPSAATVMQHVDQALSGASIVLGGKGDLATTYRGLINADKRLILLTQIGATGDASKYDSYSDSAYATAWAGPIINALMGMNQSGQQGSDYTVLQLQGTATALDSGIFSSIATMSDASSPLMSTKAAFDNQTYPWISQNIIERLDFKHLIVCLNDFADNALAAACAQITYQRAYIIGQGGQPQ